MSDPKYNTYAGELRFDDDNIVDVNLEPDTENITVRLNGVEITSGGGDLPEVDSEDNGKVLTVVSGEWAKAAPASGGGSAVYYIHAEYDDGTLTVTETISDILAAITAGKMLIMDFTDTSSTGGYAYPVTLNTTQDDEFLLFVLETYTYTNNDLDSLTVTHINYEGSGVAGTPGSWDVHQSSCNFGSGGVS